MYKEKVIVTVIPILKAGQVVNFQVKIPHDAERIIGIETSIRYTNNPLVGSTAGAVSSSTTGAAGTTGTTSTTGGGTSTGTPPAINMKFSQDTLMGDVRLQSCENTNILYSESVFYIDANINFVDYSATIFPPTVPTHGLAHEECTVNTNGKTSILKGIYRDLVQGMNSSGIIPAFTPYQMRLYIWYEKKTAL